MRGKAKKPSSRRRRDVDVERLYVWLSFSLSCQTRPVLERENGSENAMGSIRNDAVDDLYSKIILHDLRQPTKQCPEKRFELSKEAGVDVDLLHLCCSLRNLLSVDIILRLHREALLHIFSGEGIICANFLAIDEPMNLAARKFVVYACFERDRGAIVIGFGRRCEEPKNRSEMCLDTIISLQINRS